MGHLILINKEYGKTSNDIVQIVKKYTESKKVGHSGTLDPLATGLLLIATEEKTKELSKIINFSKEYIVEIKFGEHRDTYDAEGIILKKKDYFPSIDLIKKTIEKFLLIEYFQEVPIYSSVKLKGKKLYEYAREKIDVQLPIKKVFIDNIELIHYRKDKKIVKLKLNVKKGFYVRSFAVDFAKEMESYAYVYSLRRTKIGDYKLEDAIFNYEDLWKYHSKVKLIDSNLEYEKKIKNLFIGHFDIIHIEQKVFFNYENLNILTFVNNPSKNFYFNSNINRIWNISELNVDKIFVYDILKNNLDSKNFNNLILKKLKPDNIIIGSNFKYGKNHGNYKDLKADFNIDIINNKTNLSSTQIRNLLIEGQFKKANNFVLNFIKFKGVVIHGNKRGRLLNFPTVNIEWNTNLKIKSGSYISLTKIGKKIYPSTTFVKSLNKYLILTETFIHNFNALVYGKILEVWPIDFIAAFSLTRSKELLIKKISQEVAISKNFHLKNKINSADEYINFLKNKDKYEK